MKWLRYSDNADQIHPATGELWPLNLDNTEKQIIDEQSESIDLDRDLEQSELIRPITKQGVLYVSSNKLIETFVFGF